MIEFTSIQQMLEETSSSGLPLWDAIRQADCQRQGISPQQSWDKMAAMLQAMEDADRSYQETDRSHSGLSGGDGGKMARYIRAGKPLCGPFLSEVMAGALRMGECNACMKRIVAAPTAGACGVLPAVLLPYARQFQAEADRLVEALYVASGFGMVIAARASISGAEGGCQAEIGSAAAMAAPALVHLQGGTPEQMANACAMAVKNLLGLVCDPVGGLVEVPCVKRNVIGAMDALSAAQMALAGIESRVPPDQVLDAMREVGQSLPHTLRETGKGGLAATPFGLRYTPKEVDKR
ncbi:L-serine ammonia-lyase, iron-sulfur-dependent, subunit alpha [Clostridiales bacterium]